MEKENNKELFSLVITKENLSSYIDDCCKKVTDKLVTFNSFEKGIINHCSQKLSTKEWNKFLNDNVSKSWYEVVKKGFK